MYQSMSQQPSGFNNQQSFQSPQQYEPIGNVQSHYQGQLSQPSFGRPMNSIVSSPINNYQQTSQYGQSGMNFGQQQFTSNQQQFNTHQPVQSHASSPATAFGNVGPVIAHYGGYQANSSQPQSYSQGMQPFGQNQQQSYGSQTFGGRPVQSQTSEHPVYQATNAYEQAGPVISRYGWQAGPNR